MSNLSLSLCYLVGGNGDAQVRPSGGPVFKRFLGKCVSARADTIDTSKFRGSLNREIVKTVGPGTKTSKVAPIESSSGFNLMLLQYLSKSSTDNS